MSLYFSQLPLDVLEEIALHLPYDDIINLCKTDDELANICSNPNFWKNKADISGYQYPEKYWNGDSSSKYLRLKCISETSKNIYSYLECFYNIAKYGTYSEFIELFEKSRKNLDPLKVKIFADSFVSHDPECFQIISDIISPLDTIANLLENIQNIKFLVNNLTNVNYKILLHLAIALALLGASSYDNNQFIEDLNADLYSE